MTFRYQSGQVIAPNAIEAIRFAGKVGFLTKELWNTYFAKGEPRWKERQLHNLVEKGYLKKHRNDYAKHVWVLNEKSIRLLESIRQPCVSPVPITYLSHDIVVARSLLELQKEKLIRSFQVEREFKTYGVKDFLLSSKDHDQKYPDAVFKINAFGSERTVAIEYERERKSSSRYKNILWQYTGLSNFSMVLFIYETTGIKNAITSAIKYLGQTGLLDKIAYVPSSEWKASPLDAKIELVSQKIKLREICVPMKN